MKFKAIIFDMDGVITDTARVHYKAWKITLDEFLKKQSEVSNKIFPPFTKKDYLHYIDGLDRIDGTRNFLYARQIYLPLGTERDSFRKLTIYGLAANKAKRYLNFIKTEKIKVFHDSIQLINHLKEKNIRIAVISASRNCKKILKKSKVITLFDAIVDGKEIKKLRLKGKPSPAIFLEAANRLQVTPDETAVVEDALAGVKAALAGKFKLVIALDRRNLLHTDFKNLGATIILKKLSALNYEKIYHYFSQSLPSAIIHFKAIKQRLLNKHLVICLDYDGTLTPIIDNPKFAIISQRMRHILLKLSERFPIIIISGRQLIDLQEKINIKNIYYAGNHGLEITSPKHFPKKIERGSEFIEELDKIYKELLFSLSSIKNCIIENKTFSLSIHYRLVDKNKIFNIKKIIIKIMKKHRKFIKKNGKKVFEIHPNIKWNKGKTLLFILNKYIQKNYERYFPIYIGDDLSDESAFSAIRKKGVGILVAKVVKKTKATYQLRNINEVYSFLKKIKKRIDFKLDTTNSWLFTYDDFKPKHEKTREALCTLGNGYFAVRGAAEESKINGINYPGTYFIGCYNKLISTIEGKKILNEDMVNMPNGLSITFKLNNDNAWFNLSHVEILDYCQILHLYQSTLQRFIRFKDKKGRIIHFESIRFVSMVNSHIAGIRITLQVENWSGKLILKSGLNGGVSNKGVARYKKLKNKHLETIKLGKTPDNTIYLLMRTSQSRIEIAEIAQHCFYINGIGIYPKTHFKKGKNSIYQISSIFLHRNEKLTIEKYITYTTSKDNAISETLHDADIISASRKNFRLSLKKHCETWENLWKHCDILIDSKHNIQQKIRLHIFHLLQTVSKNTLNRDIGIPARGIHGEAYRGHVFWDELFILPFYIFHFPEIARSLLLYRYHRLAMARHLAKQAGYKGAMFPWQSGSNGEEVSQELHFNPLSHTWTPDYSRYQHHVNTAIVYNIWQYYCATNDNQFMEEYGAEIILEIANFWSSISFFNNKIGRYEIEDVMGPDEYHEKYPSSEKPGLKNNAYTNVTAVWTLEKALKILKIINTEKRKELTARLEISTQEINRWKDITFKMVIPFHKKDIISQFEGYELLTELNWPYYRKKYGNIERLDRILKAEGDTPDNYKISKQADVLMLFYLFPIDDLTKLFKKLGYPFSKAILKKNIEYYTKRTSHGSTLSKLVFASVYHYIDKEKAFNYYQEVLNHDFVTDKNNTTQEGIHLGAMGGCITFIMQRLAGLQIKNNRLIFKPSLPNSVYTIKLHLFFRGKWSTVFIKDNKLKIA